MMGDIDIQRAFLRSVSVRFRTLRGKTPRAGGTKIFRTPEARNHLLEEICS